MSMGRYLNNTVEGQVRKRSEKRSDRWSVNGIMAIMGQGHDKRGSKLTYCWARMGSGVLPQCSLVESGDIFLQPG